MISWLNPATGIKLPVCHLDKRRVSDLTKVAACNFDITQSKA